MNDVIPAAPKAQADLANRWSRALDFSAFDRPDEPGAWNLVFSLRSIEESCRALLDKEFPSLMRAAEGQEIRNALLDVELQLRHLVYHARDARYLNVDIFGPGEDHTAGSATPKGGV